ncbi:MAG: hypothetical protein CMM25_01845 [Rhodospirillaceae bacterium]|nr:hypothetical protein [Rhodospirillaceae bacterium]
MDETLGTLLLCAFILYWVFVRDPVAPEDRKLDKDTRTYLCLAATILAVWSGFKLHASGGKGLTSFGSALTSNPAQVGGELAGQAVDPTSGEAIAPQKASVIPRNVDTTKISMAGPHVLDGKSSSFWKSNTTNDAVSSRISKQTNISASADS